MISIITFCNERDEKSYLYTNMKKQKMVTENRAKPRVHSDGYVTGPKEFHAQQGALH